jgi:hypothetical protein
VRVAWGHPQPGDVLERDVFASCHVAEMGQMGENPIFTMVIWNMNGLTFGTFGKSITFTKYINFFLQKMGI